MQWTADAAGRYGFGGWWHAYVARPLFLTLLIGWIWRVCLVAAWMWRISRLELALVPTHPDRTGGLAFVESLPAAFAMVSFAVSATIASRWAHDILHHGTTVASLQQPSLVFVLLWSALMLLPLLPFVPALMAARTRALASYSALVTRHGQLVHRKWILGERITDERLLEAPEIGPIADAGAMYLAAARMRSVPIGKRALMTVLLPIAIPLAAVAALQIPLPQMLLKIVGALV
jgi:hypothetical protein